MKTTHELRSLIGDGEEHAPCPFCGCDAVEFDGNMNNSMFFVNAYCPNCRVRFEFQKVKKGKVEANNLKKAKKAFEKRVQSCTLLTSLDSRWTDERA